MKKVFTVAMSFVFAGGIFAHPPQASYQAPARFAAAPLAAPPCHPAPQSFMILPTAPPAPPPVRVRYVPVFETAPVTYSAPVTYTAPAAYTVPTAPVFFAPVPRKQYATPIRDFLFGK